MTDIIGGINSITNDLKSLGRRTNDTVKTPNGIIRNSRSIIWSVVGLPDDIKIADLMMKINPSNISENYQKIINTKRTLGGFIREHWGDQLDSISASGITAGFVGDKGLTNFARRDTEAWKNFQALVDIYRNNGSIYDTKTTQIIAQGSVVMTYDSTVRHGYFESFQIREMADKPYNLEYEFVFKVTYDQAPGRRTSFRDVNAVKASTFSSSKLDDSSLSRATLDIVGDL